jgi:hypothetical protein
MVPDLPFWHPLSAHPASRMCAQFDIDQIPDVPLIYIEKAQYPVLFSRVAHKYTVTM